MEEGYEFTLAMMRRTILEQTDINALYIPLQGKHTTNLDEEPFDLAEKINSFFVVDKISVNDPKVMLLMGDTGSGKSMFTQQLHQQLWRAYKIGDPIPLWIPLPELLNPFEGAVEEVLKNYEFSESQIGDMKVKERFIFIVDGYDECHQFQNCYVTNKWDKWAVKVLITCRSQALYYQKDPDKYFVPFDGEKRLAWSLRKLHIAPFSLDQIKAYLEAHNRWNSAQDQYESRDVELHKKNNQHSSAAVTRKTQDQESASVVTPNMMLDPEIKVEDFDKIPGLKELITTPFLLHLSVEALPDILANLGTEEENPKMTQAKLYDVFVEQWIARQIKKIRAANIVIPGLTLNSEIKQQFWHYCKRLAQQMHINEITVIPYSEKTVRGRLFGQSEKKNIWDVFLTKIPKF